eukprot:4655274-Amphidinium_carterae.1
MPLVPVVVWSVVVHMFGRTPCGFAMTQDVSRCGSTRCQETFKWIREGDEAEFDDLMKAMERRESPGNTSRLLADQDV